MDYAYRVEWSPEDNEFVGLVAEFPSLSWLAPTRAEAMQGIVSVVEQVAAEMADAQDVERGGGDLMADGTWDPELVGSSAFHKLEHGFEIRDRLRDVLAEQQAVERQYSRRDNRTDHASRRTWAEWALESDLDYTESALLMGGDFVHNLRAALDHAVWAITPQHIRQERPTEVAFPLRSTEKSSTTWAKKRRDWYGPTVFEVIRSNQPFNAAGTGTLHPLHILQFLSNTDKHQLLNIVANSQVDMGGVSVDPEPPGGVVSSVNQGVVAKIGAGPGGILQAGESGHYDDHAHAGVRLRAGLPVRRPRRYGELVGRR